MLRTFKILVEDYITPDGTELSRDLLSRLSPHISFLSQCQPHCDAMGNAIKALKREISEGESTKGQDDEAAKRSLCDWIDRYMQSIEYAQVLIADYAVQKINDGDVILTHGSSQLMAKVIRKACQDGKRFRVVVVDSRPTPNGGHVLRECSRIGIKCTFVLINAVSCVMREVSKVFLTAHALLANGYASPHGAVARAWAVARGVGRLAFALRARVCQGANGPLVAGLPMRAASLQRFVGAVCAAMRPTCH